MRLKALVLRRIKFSLMMPSAHKLKFLQLNILCTHKSIFETIGDVEIDMLRKRLEETEAAMERIVSQMGTVTDQLSPTVLAQVLRARGVRTLCKN